METETVVVYERYYKVGDDVYREWSFDGKMWCIEWTWTPYRNPPWIVIGQADLGKLPKLSTNE